MALKLIPHREYYFHIIARQAAFLITLNVAFCICEILGFMYAIGIVIDSVSVINVVLAVGLSIDYSAHIGHCFMVKGGNSKDARATEALAVSSESAHVPCFPSSIPHLLIHSIHRTLGHRF